MPGGARERDLASWHWHREADPVAPLVPRESPRHRLALLVPTRTHHPVAAAATNATSSAATSSIVEADAATQTSRRLQARRSHPLYPWWGHTQRCREHRPRTGRGGRRRKCSPKCGGLFESIRVG